MVMMKARNLPIPAPASPPDPGRLWRKLKASLAQIPFAGDLLAAYYCALDPQTPAHVRGVLFGAVVYFLTPADAIPDLVLGLGFSDDAAVIAAVLSLLGRHVTDAHRQRAQTRLEQLRGGGSGERL